jgi:two-component system response regulator YesN
MNEFTLMIADDEKIIRDGLLNSINWEALGYQVVAVASDGEEALELFREHRPAVVIMDIKMPIMDGLQVLEKFKSEQGDTEVILLSGYDEFAYAKKGMKEGAYDYIIKIDVFTELEDSLKRLHQVLTHRQEEAKQYNHLLVLKDDYLFQECIKGRSPMEFSRAGSVYTFCVVAIWIPSMSSLSVDFRGRSLFSIPYLMRIEQDYMHFIFYEEDKNSQPFLKRLVDSLHKLELQLDRNGITKYKMGIGNMKPTVAEVPHSYREAMKTIDYQRSRDADYSEPCLLFYKDWKGQDISVNYKMIPVRNWVNWVYSGDYENLAKWVQTIFAEACVNKKITLSDMYHLCVQIIAQFEKVAKEKGSDEISLNEFDSLMDLEAYVIRILKSRSETLHSNLQLQKNKSIAAVKEYVDEMYMTNLSMEEVAHLFYFSPGYLSAKFKEFAGMSFSQYLITKRIETACQLLSGTEMKIYEIAKEVGYTDEKHFSKLFTRIVQMGPREYRKYKKD